MTTANIIRRALYNKMSNSHTLINMLGAAATGYTKSIYHGIAPEGAAFPYVLFNKQSGTPTDALGFRSLASDPSPPVETRLEDADVWLVKGVDRAPSADVAEGIALQIHALLSDGSFDIGLGIVYLRRESDVDYAEVIEGVQYRHAGALYRLVRT